MCASCMRVLGVYAHVWYMCVCVCASTSVQWCAMIHIAHATRAVGEGNVLPLCVWVQDCVQRGLVFDTSAAYRGSVAYGSCVGSLVVRTLCAGTDFDLREGWMGGQGHDTFVSGRSNRHKQSTTGREWRWYGQQRRHTPAQRDTGKRFNVTKAKVLSTSSKQTCETALERATWRGCGRSTVAMERRPTCPHTGSKWSLFSGRRLRELNRSCCKRHTSGRGAEGKMGKGVMRGYSRCDKSQQAMVTRARKRSRDRTRCLERWRQQSGGTHGLTG
jgi:hypothetical protein